MGSIVDQLRTEGKPLRNEVEALEKEWVKDVQAGIGSGNRGPIWNFLETYLHDQYHKRRLDGKIIGKRAEITGHDAWLSTIQQLGDPVMDLVYQAPDHVVVHGEDTLSAGGLVYHCIWRDTWRLVDPVATKPQDRWRCVEVLELAAMDITAFAPIIGKAQHESVIEKYNKKPPSNPFRSEK